MALKRSAYGQPSDQGTCSYSTSYHVNKRTGEP